jgi:hypothetical protein
MKYLLILLGLSVVAIAAAAGALLWRLRWHLRRPHVTPPAPAPELEREEQPAQKA